MKVSQYILPTSDLILRIACKVISNPMDLQSMLKKVKQKQYKSKREFKDDLELIWSNCYTYNATEVRSFFLQASNGTHTNCPEPPPPPMRQTIKNKSRQATQEYHRQEGTHGPIYTLQSPHKSKNEIKIKWCVCKRSYSPFCLRPFQTL